VPVWSDTLQPEIQDLASVLQIAHSVNYELTMTSSQGSKKSKERSTSTISVSSSPIHFPEAEPSPQHVQSASELRAKSGTPTLWRQSDSESEIAEISLLHQKPPPTGLHSLPRRRLPPIPSRMNLLRQHQEAESKVTSQLDLTSPDSPADTKDSEIAALIARYSEDRIDHPLAPTQGASEVEEEQSSAELALMAPTVKRMVFKLNRNLPRKNTGVPSRAEGDTVSNDPITPDSDEVHDQEMHLVTDEADSNDVEYLASMFLQR